ncbi:MAG: hypothetical protein AB8B79_14095 [Granulosicoccus sp.]
MSEVAGAAMHQYRWFESDGLYMAINRASGNSISELGLEPDSHIHVQDLLDAVLLADHDPLLQCLEVWSGQVFDWTPMTAAKPDNPQEETVDQLNADNSLHYQTHLPRLTISLSSLEGQKRTIYLAIAHDELRQMPELPEQWQSLVKLTRHARLYEAVLQKKILRTDEYEKLCPGALLLLPDSFSSLWAVQMQPISAENSSEAPAISGELSTESNAIRLMPNEAIQQHDQTVGSDADQSAELDMEISLKTSLLINQLYAESAWQSGQNVLIALPQLLESVPVVIKCQMHKLKLQGRVVSLGSGYAVLVDGPDLSNDANED